MPRARVQRFVADNVRRCYGAEIVQETLAAVVEGGQAVERSVPSGKTKPVSYLKNGTGNNEMAAAFWNDLAMKMHLVT